MRKKRLVIVDEPHVPSNMIDKDLDPGYKRMAEDKTREAEALEWVEATFGDVADETQRGLS